MIAAVASQEAQGRKVRTPQDSVPGNARDLSVKA